MSHTYLVWLQLCLMSKSWNELPDTQVLSGPTCDRMWSMSVKDKIPLCILMWKTLRDHICGRGESGFSLSSVLVSFTFSYRLSGIEIKAQKQIRCAKMLPSGYFKTLTSNLNTAITSTHITWAIFRWYVSRPSEILTPNELSFSFQGCVWTT